MASPTSSAMRMRFTDSGRILAVASRTQSRMGPAGSTILISPDNTLTTRRWLKDEDIDVIYIATIHPLHAEWAIKCAEAGKHILVEKPISMNRAEAAAMIDAARENDVFLMEAFMYRCHPQIQRVVQLIQDGAIGDAHIVRATFGGQVNFQPRTAVFITAKWEAAVFSIWGAIPLQLSASSLVLPKGSRFCIPLW